MFIKDEASEPKLPENMHEQIGLIYCTVRFSSSEQQILLKTL